MRSPSTEPSGAYSVSIIVPAYKEAANIPVLCRRVFGAMDKSGLHNCELIIVDDNSCDGTKECCAQLSGDYPGLRLITRQTERGLSSAVLRGFDDARGRILLCMDADLQHPPESVPDLVRALSGKARTFALGTRYGEHGGIDKDWPTHRRIISWGARLLARPLSAMTDPMSGFFGLTRELYLSARPRVSPVGYKIALELYVKSGVSRAQLAEVPFVFGTRNQGESKLTGKVIVHYLQHLVQLYWYCYRWLLLLLVALLVAAAAGWALL
eukprot:TRINITY_DN70507_c0_g1_i1.p1 TRINITY_DN70507_c0_g1~~TRINITY_DN70507_c0_g1_i1.p1  ORF type:complete len:305 (+),score=100.32 TRINITY_DN70507_c0_g1_i1:113-916(+)